MKRVFVSSTVYDLIDARAEVEECIRDMGLHPVMSDRSTSEFQVQPDQNSIETCLTNLRQCDAAVFLFSQRYGPSLESAGFDDVSATHLEYLEARKASLPIYVYVRDRLIADIDIATRNPGRNVNFAWMKGESNRRLETVINEHRQLSADDGSSNWFETFSDSVQVKQLIRRDFRARAGRVELRSLVVQNQAPILDAELVTEQISDMSYLAKLRVCNVGNAVAFDVGLQWNNLDEGVHHARVVSQLAPGRDLKHGFELTLPEWQDKLVVDYRFAQGHRVKDEFDFRFRILGPGITANTAILKERTYFVDETGSEVFRIVDSGRRTDEISQ